MGILTDQLDKISYVFRMELLAILGITLLLLFVLYELRLIGPKN